MPDAIKSDGELSDFLASVLQEYEAVISQLIERTAWRPASGRTEAASIPQDLAEAA